MNNALHNVVEILKQPPAADLKETLLEAALLIEKSIGENSWQGISATVDEAIVTEEGIAELKAALMNFIQKNPEHPSVGSAIWALGRFFDDSLRGFFLDELRRYYEARQSHPTEQAVSVLQVIDEVTIHDFAPGEVVSERFFESVGNYLKRNPPSASLA